MLPRFPIRDLVGAPASTPRGRSRHGVLALLTAGGLLGVLAASVAGCPVYSADSCAQDPLCAPPDQPPVDASTGGSCDPGCTPGYVCSYTTTNRYGCVAYDCRSVERACTSGQACVDLGGGVFGCSGGDAGPLDTADTADAADTKEAGPIDCSTPGVGCITGYKCVGDATGHRCVSTDPNACVEDRDCAAKTGAGSLCLGGLCKAPKDLCSDSTQCSAGKLCVDGRCAQQCGGDGGGAGCPSGYACVSGACVGGTGVCTTPAGGDAGVDDAGDAADAPSDVAADAAPDTAPDAGSCKNACVATRCIDRCALDGSCAAGLVCDGVGCVPDDRPIFFCDKAGTTDGTQDLCASGSICLHHNCYLSCTGPTDTTSCASADKFPICKSVTSSSGDHFVCGSATGLGAECDPTTTPPRTCAAGQFCVDGFCK